MVSLDFKIHSTLLTKPHFLQFNILGIFSELDSSLEKVAPGKMLDALGYYTLRLPGNQLVGIYHQSQILAELW